MKLRGDAVWKALFRLVRYRTLWVAAVVVILAAFAYLYTRDVPLRSSYFDLLPKNDPLVLAYEENQIYLASTDSVVLLLTLRNAEDVTLDERKAALLRAAEAIARPLRADPEFKSVVYLIEPAPAIPDQYVALWRLDKESLAKIEDSVALVRGSFGQTAVSVPTNVDLAEVYRSTSAMVDDAVATGFSFTSGGPSPDLSSLLALNQAVLAGVGGVSEFPRMTEAVSQIADLLAPKAQVTREGIPFFSRDATSLLMSVLPQQTAQVSVAYCRKVQEALQRGLDQANLGALGITVGVAGTYSMIAETNDVVGHDMQRTGWITGAGVMIVFLISFGSVLYSLIATIPLVFALLLTSVWTKGALDGFNLLTTFVPSLILGMGDDFAIHLISRYAEERSNGLTFSKSVFLMLSRKGPAIFLGATTIFLVFLGLLTARSRALFELGAIASVGILFAILSALVLIPTLLTLSRFLRGRRRQREKVAALSPHFAGFFRALTHPVGATVVLVVIGCVTGLAAYLATGVRFQFSSSDLIPSTQSSENLDRILTSFELGGANAQLGTTFLFFATTEDEMKELDRRLAVHPLVLAVDSASQYLPANLAEQQAALRAVNLVAYADQLAALDRSLAARDEVLLETRTLLTRMALVQYAATLNGYASLGFEASEAEGQLLEVQTALRTIDVPSARVAVQELESAVRSLDTRLAGVRDLPPVETLLRDILRSLPAEIRTRYLTEDGRYIVRARMNPGLYDRSNLIGFIQFSNSISSDYFGVPLVVRSLESAMKRDFFISTALAALFIAFIVWRSFRTLPKMLLALSPVILGYVWMLGGMRLLGVNFNFINITISPLLIGLGIESGVALLFRYKEEQDKDPRDAMARAGATTIVAILASMFTTMLVFASLLLARTPGLRFLGTCALLGIGFSLLITIFFVPAAVALTHPGERRKKGSEAN
jgi:predicted RND superfamily exporter protein